MPLFLFPFLPQSGALERPQPRREVGVPCGRGAARTTQEGHQEETGEPRLAGGEPEEVDFTHGRLPTQF